MAEKVYVLTGGWEDEHGDTYMSVASTLDEAKARAVLAREKLTLFRRNDYWDISEAVVDGVGTNFVSYGHIEDDTIVWEDREVGDG